MGIVNSVTIRFAAIALVLAIGSVFTYHKFTTFKAPRNNSTTAAVRGTSTSKTPENLPFLPSATQINYDRTSSDGLVSMTVSESSDGVYKFYKNILLGKGWGIKEDVDYENGRLTSYRKGDNKISVTILEDPVTKLSIVTLEYSTNN